MLIEEVNSHCAYANAQVTDVLPPCASDSFLFCASGLNSGENLVQRAFLKKRVYNLTRKLRRNMLFGLLLHPRRSMLDALPFLRPCGYGG